MPTPDPSWTPIGRAMRDGIAVFLKLFAPCEALMRSLKLGQKFALIAVVLIAPLAFVTYSYVSAQGKQEAFSTKERAGLAAVRPLVALLGAVDEARSGAAHSNPAAVSGVQAAADGVDPVLTKLRGELDLSRSWPALKRRTAAATAMTPATGPRAVAAWDRVSTDAVKLIAEAADRSNLTLDPDLDTYYLQDTINVKIPTLLDAGGRAADLAAVDARAHHDAIAIASGTVASTVAATTTNVQKAIKNTDDSRLGPSSAGPLSALGRDTAAMTAALAEVSATDRAPTSDIAATSRRDALALSRALDVRLGNLLEVRINALQRSKHVVEGIALLALVVLLWLFVGFYRSMTQGVRRQIYVLDAVAAGDFSRPANTSADEVGQMGAALNRTRERMSGTVDGIARTSATLSASSDELSAVSQQMSAAAEETAAQAASVSAGAEQVSHHVQSVAAGAEELDASIHEIAKNTSDAARVASQAVSVAETTNDVVLRLGTSSAEIGEVIKVITSIAEQTNLLALNATIEAARAGEAGKGFGVVASEVKDLARRTALSSEKIGRNIATIQSDAQEAVTAIGEITSIIRQINDIQTVVAAAVEEQAATTSEIGRSVGEAASGSDDIARNITGVAEAAQSTTQGAAETHRSAEELARLAGELLALVGKFQLIGLDESSPPAEEPSRPADTGIGVLSPGADVPDANVILERVAAANRRS